MIPTSDNQLLQDDFTQAAPLPDTTYQIVGDRLGGRIEGVAALRQSIDLLLCTERFAHSIYSTNYGVETAALFGQPTALVCARLRGAVEEALLTDDRIFGVGEITFTQGDGALTLQVTVHSRLGELAYEGGVTLGL